MNIHKYSGIVDSSVVYVMHHKLEKVIINIDGVEIHIYKDLKSDVIKVQYITDCKIMKGIYNNV